jgi:hypothetical protein
MEGKEAASDSETRLRRTEAETSDLVLKGITVIIAPKGVAQSWWRVSNVSSLFYYFKFIISYTSLTGRPAGHPNVAVMVLGSSSPGYATVVRIACFHSLRRCQRS